MSTSTAVPMEPRLRRVVGGGPSPAVSQAAENSSYDDFVAASVDDSPRTTERTNPPSRGNSFAGHPAVVGVQALNSEGTAVGGSPLGDSAEGPGGAFTRDDEFRLKSLQRILSSHSGNPLDPADASQLCAELAALEERQQVFLRASLARMHADAASAGNLRAGHGGGGTGWGGWLRRAVSTVVGAPGPQAGGSAASVPTRKASEPAEQVAAVPISAAGAGAPHHKLKIDADVDASASDAETDATVLQHSPTPADSIGPSPAHRNHHQHQHQQQQHGGGGCNANGDGAASGGDHQVRHHHQRANSSGVSTLVRRSVAGRAHDPAWVLVPAAPQTPTPGAAATPAEPVSDVDEAAGGANGPGGPPSGWEGGPTRDDQADVLAPQQQHRQRPSTTATATSRRTIRQAAAGIVLNWRKDAFGAAAALGVGPVRPVVLVTAALLLVTITIAPTDVFTGVGTTHSAATLAGAVDSAAQRRPADILAALRSHVQHAAGDTGGRSELKPETAEEFVSRHRHMHSITHLTAAAAALFAGAVLLQPTSAPRRDRIVAIVRVAHVAVGLAFVGLLGDIAVAAVDLHRFRGGLGGNNPVGDVWDAVDACIGTSILLFWYAAVDAMIFAIATSVLQRLGTGAAKAAGDRDGGTPSVTPKATTAV